MKDINVLVQHVLQTPDIAHSECRFLIDKHEADYKDNIISNIREHKLWTPSKTWHYRCFLMMRMENRKLIIQHVLDKAENWLNRKSDSTLLFSDSSTLASQLETGDQFKGMIIVKLNKIFNDDEAMRKKCFEIKDLIVSITDETVNRGLNLRKGIRKKT